MYWLNGLDTQKHLYRWIDHDEVWKMVWMADRLQRVVMVDQNKD